ncbi:MAG: hypothetical protein AB8I08_30470 [Sandaracinaceae bacterium]
MSELLGTTVAQLLDALKNRRVRLPSEIGAFVALEVTEALIDGPAAPRPGDVRIASDGTISVFAPPGSATSEDAARSVVGLLGSLLVAAGTGVPKVLVALLDQGPSTGRWDLSSLRDDLEASLVPLNRAAARRILSRMIREAERSGASVAPPMSEPPPPNDASLDAQLDDLLGGALSEPPVPGRLDSLDEPGHDPLGMLDELDRELDATLDGLDDLDSVRPPARAAALPPARSNRPPPAAAAPANDATVLDEGPDLLAKAESLAAALDEVPEDAPRPKKRRAPAIEDAAPLGRGSLSDEDLLMGLDEKPKRGGALPWVLAIVAVVAATSAALVLMRPDLVDMALGRPPAPEEPAGPTPEEQAQMLRDHRARWGTLTVRVLPEGAQVLMFVGRGPATAEQLPLGVAHEFVAIADGRVPTRAVLPPDGTWEELEDGTQRYELAMQTGDDEMSEADLALGETRLPQDVGAPSTTLGTVRVITNPPGAKVYLLIGFAPDVRVENISAQDAVELLVYHEGHPVHREVVSPSDWVEAEDGAKTADLEITLEGYEPEE